MSSEAMSLGDLVLLRRQVIENEGQSLSTTGVNNDLLHRLLDHAMVSMKHPAKDLNHAPKPNISSPASPGFLDIPNEILAMITRLLYARDLENFVLVNRHIHDQSTKAMKDNRKWKAKYAAIENVPRPADSSLKFKYLAKLAVKLFKIPHLGLYIETLRANDHSVGWSGHAVIGGADHDDHPGYPLRELAEVHASLSGMERPMKDAKYEDWTDCYNGDEESALALVIQQAPNLRILDLDVADTDCVDTMELVKKALHGSGSSAFSKLDTLSLRNTDIYPNYFSIIEYFIQLPSLRCIHLTGPFGTSETDRPMRVGAKFSNVTSLFIRDCHLDTKILHSLVACMKLKHLSCVSQNQSLRTEVDPYWIICALRTRSTETLESLELLGFHDTSSGGDDPIWVYLGPLTDFTGLKTITIDLGLLAHELASKKVCLGDELPAQIQKVTFHVHQNQEEDEHFWNINRLFQQGHQALPRLQNLEFKGPFAKSVEFKAAINGQLIHGIMLRGGAVSFDDEEHG